MRAEGRQVTLVEPQPRLGGMIRSELLHGFQLECGPNVFLEKSELKTLISELNLTGSVRYPTIQPFKQFVWMDGLGAVSVPKGPKNFFQSKLLSFPDKIRILTRILKKRVLKPDAEDETVLEFFSRLLGERLVKTVMDPALRGIYGGDVDKLSARSVFPNLWEAAKQGDSLMSFMRSKGKGGSPQILIIENGNERLVNALWLTIQKSVQLIESSVLDVAPDQTGDRKFRINLKNGSEIGAEKVWVTTAGPATAQILRGLAPVEAEKLSKISYANLCSMHVSVSKHSKMLEDGFGIMFPRPFAPPMLGAMFNSVLFPHVAPPDRHLCTFMFGTIDNADLLSWPDERFFVTAMKALDGICELKDAELLKVTRWPRAIPQFQVGHHSLVKDLRSLEDKYRGLKFIGVDCGGVGVSDRVRVALTA